MAYTKAELGPRLLAALVDGLIAGVAGVVLPVIGGLIGAVYLLTKDALMYQITSQAQWKNRSIGKKIFNLQVVHLGGQDVDLGISVQRNVPLAIGQIIMIVPILGWIIGPPVSLVIGIIEVYLVLTESGGRRLGDRWANTQVVGEAVPEPEQLP